MDKVRILIADDHTIVRTGLTALLGTVPGLEVVGETKNGEEAVQQAAKLKPDLVIMDLIMPKKDGAAATAEIISALPDTRVLVLTSVGTSDAIA